jgi:hypothetical protein
MNQIAERFGVTRQRVSALLRKTQDQRRVPEHTEAKSRIGGGHADADG